MGTRKFDLENAVEQWQMQLLQKKHLTEDNVLELRSHMEEEIDALLSNNRSEEEAFAIAQYRLGDMELIDSEYQKVNWGLESIDLIGKFSLGAACYFLIVCISGLFINSIMIAAVHFGFGEASIFNLNTITHLFCFFALLAFFYRSVKTNGLYRWFSKPDNIFTIAVSCVISIFLYYFSKVILFQLLNIQLIKEIVEVRMVTVILFHALFVAALFALALYKRRSQTIETAFV